jgi:hypothetical protein
VPVAPGRIADVVREHQQAARRHHRDHLVAIDGQLGRVLDEGLKSLPSQFSPKKL